MKKSILNFSGVPIACQPTNRGWRGPIPDHLLRASSEQSLRTGKEDWSRSSFSRCVCLVSFPKHFWFYSVFQGGEVFSWYWLINLTMKLFIWFMFCICILFSIFSDLLDHIIFDTKMGLREKKKKLLKFRDAYPNIWQSKFPTSETLPEYLRESNSSSSRERFPSLTRLKNAMRI
jgi:hypothetical protein